MRTIVFDMMGLIAGFPNGYPNLEDIVIKSLSEVKDTEIGFWTRDRRNDYQFKEWGNFFIGKEDIKDLGFVVQTKNQDLLSEVCQRTRLGESLGDMEGLIERWNRWQKSRGVIFDYKEWKTYHKYPPLLGNECSLLIESDLGSINSLGKIKRESSLSDESLTYARRMNFSLILVPEYPNVWEGKNCSVTSDEVLIYLRDTLLGWQGEEIQKDIGIEMGIYTKEGK